MQDAIQFQQDVARFSDVEAAYIVDLLRNVFSIRTARGEEDQLLGDFIDALDSCDCITIFEEQELLVDAD